MFPAKVSDAQIRTLIRELTVQGKPPSGATLRAVLATRYHSRGGVTRIYRLLAAERARLRTQPPDTWAGVTARVLEQENKNLHHNMQQVLRREQQHQAYWSSQVGQLREQIEALTARIENAAASRSELTQLRQSAQEAEVRGGRLEVLLRAFGPGARDKPDRG